MDREKIKEKLRKQWWEIAKDRFDYLLSYYEAFNSVGKKYQIGVHTIRRIIEIWNKNEKKQVTLDQLEYDMINEDMDLFEENIDEFLDYCEREGKTFYDIWDFENWLRERIVEGFPVGYQVEWNDTIKVVEVAFFTAIGGPTYYYLLVVPIDTEVEDERIEIVLGNAYFDFSKWLEEYAYYGRCDGAWELTTLLSEMMTMVEHILEQEREKIIREIADELRTKVI